MARPRKMILTNLFDDVFQIRISFKVSGPDQYLGLTEDTFDEDEQDVTFHLRGLEIRHDENEEFVAYGYDEFSDEELEQIEEELREQYIMRSREKYAARLTERY